MDQRPIVLFLDSRQLGGIETHIYHLANALKASHPTVIVWFYKQYQNHHPLEEKLTKSGVTVEYLQGSPRSLFQKTKSTKPLLLHTHGYKAGVLGRMAATILRIPVISTFHNGDKGQGIVRFYTWLDKLSSFLSENIAVSDDIARRLFSKVTVINNFIDLPGFHFNNGKNIAFVGRLSHEKGPDLFIQIAQEHPDLNFTLYGAGPDEDNLKQQAPGNAHFMGQVPDMNKYWQDIGLLCITSREEGLPMVALEAMARGIPVAAFRLGALPKLIQHNVNGWIAPKKNIQILSKLILHWSNLNDDQLKYLSKNCYQTVYNGYSYKTVLPEILSVYRKALDKKNINSSIILKNKKSSPVIDIRD